MNCTKCKKEIDTDSIYCKWCGKKQIETPAPKPLKRANGMGTVTKMPGRRRKPWLARVSVKNEKGEIKRLSLGSYELKKEAYAAIEEMTVKQELPALYNVTLEDAHERWMNKHYPQLTPKGIESYNNAWKYFDEIKKIKMRSLKTDHFQKIIDEALQKGRSKSTCEKLKQLASQLCQWAMQNDIINKNYATFIEIKATKVKKKEPFTSEELSKIWKYYKKTGNRDAAAILLLCHTGLRIDEFLSMKKSDYYDGCLHGGNKTEKGSNRIVPVPDSMNEIINDLMSYEGQYILSNSIGEKQRQDNWRKRNYYKVLEECGFPEELRKRRAPHSCRHTYSTMCAKLNMDPKALQDILGHEDFSTTMNIYTHTDIDFLKKSAQNLKFFSETEN